MERHEVSFSIPTWRREEIRSLTMIEEQSLYAGTPYNLNDFKNQIPSIGFIFSGEEQSDLKDYLARRVLSQNVQLQVAIFILFLLEGVIWDSDSQKKGVISPLQKFKEHLYSTDLCKFQSVPSEWKQYYKNDIVKKIMFQYISKCLFNMSLVELLLISNRFLRFSVVLVVKNVLLQGKIITKFQDSPLFKEQTSILVDYFQTFFHKSIKSDKKSSIFTFQRHSICSAHYMLLQKNKKIFFYRRQIKILTMSTPHLPESHTLNSLPNQEMIKTQSRQDQALRKQNINEKQRQRQKQKSKSTQKGKIQGDKNKRITNTQLRNSTSVRQRAFWDCLPCFNSKIQ